MSNISVEDEITLGQLLDRSISAYESITNEDSQNSESVQTKIISTLSDLSICSALIGRLSIVSMNETLDDINTNDLKCLAVEGLIGFLRTLLRSNSGIDRKKDLELSKQHLIQFTKQVESYQIIPSDRSNQFKGPITATQDPATRRELKIAQYKLEKQLKSQIDGYRTRQEERRRPGLYASSSRPTEGSSDPSGSATRKAIEAEDDEDDEERREAYITWLRFLYLKAHQELSSIDLELDLLGQGSQMCDLPRSPKKDQDNDLSWRLDKLPRENQGPLISPTGKVLRPFTILPSRSTMNLSAASNRIKLRAEVFRPDWNLPTMTIDEYLDEQKAMGNFLSGGGPDQADQETKGEGDQREAEEDNLSGDLKQEEMRIKAVEWDKFTDSHRKGEGNRMNRG